MDGLELTLATIVFCIIAFILSWIFRKTVEFLIPSWTDADTRWEKYWKDVILPITPAIIGGLMGLISSYPYPEWFASTPSRIFFGAFCGFVSGWIYKAVKVKLREKANMSAEQSKDEPADPFLT